MPDEICPTVGDLSPIFQLCAIEAPSKDISLPSPDLKKAQKPKKSRELPAIDRSIAQAHNEI